MYVVIKNKCKIFIIIKICVRFGIYKLICIGIIIEMNKNCGKSIHVRLFSCLFIDLCAQS